MPQFCPYCIAEFIEFLRDIHVLDQISQHHTERSASTETYVSPAFGLVADCAFASLLTGWARACGVAQSLITSSGSSVNTNKSRKRTSKDGARGDTNVNDRRWLTLFWLE